MMRELESHPKELAEIVGKKDFQGRLRFLSELRLWQESGRPNHSGWLAMSASGDLEKGVQDILKRGRMMVLSYFGMVEVRGDISLANVCDHRHRTDGATDAGEERASASGVTAGRCSVDRSVRVLSPSGYGVTLQEKPLREGEVVEIKDAHIEIQSDSGYQLSVKTETHEGGHV